MYSSVRLCGSRLVTSVAQIIRNDNHFLCSHFFGHAAEQALVTARETDGYFLLFLIFINGDRKKETAPAGVKANYGMCSTMKVYVRVLADVRQVTRSLFLGHVIAEKIAFVIVFMVARYKEEGVL